MVKVCDAIMGSGKSSAAITMMTENPDKKYIYITPYLGEVNRIKSACNELITIAEPTNKAEHGWSKINHTKDLIERGCSIVTTHQAFKYYTHEMVSIIKESGYTLIMDEVLDVLDDNEITPGELEILLRSKMVEETEPGVYRSLVDDFDGRFHDVFRIMKSRDLIFIEGDSVDKAGCRCWIITPELMDAFEDVYILTYIFEGQPLCWFLKMHNIEYRSIGVSRGESGEYRFSEGLEYIPEYVERLRDLIDICENKRLNTIGENRCALSVSWFRRGGENIDRLQKNVYNWFRNINRGTGANKRMWSTYEKYKSKLKGKSYTKGFLQCSARASNAYRHKTVLAYCVNMFMPTGQKIFFRKRGVILNEDDYALSTMIQWIWRSAIRDGKQIHIYVPSRRMRTLLTDWIDRTSNDARQRKEGIELGCCGTTEETTELL